MRSRDGTGVRRRGREAWPGPASPTARCGAAASGAVSPPSALPAPGLSRCVMAALADEDNTLSCPRPSTQCGSKNVPNPPTGGRLSHTRSPHSRSPVHSDR